ncbi:MAG: sigma-70 family RNA polymerase sigma factor [Burkholderiales bacterium]|nr:sigma-70 family RNA polymerase sigma factor [Phycisphaerae bacterium]
MTTHATDTPLSLARATETAVGLETDEFLLGRLRQGDAQSGEKLVVRYHQPLMRYLQRVCGRVELAEELHQQAWLSVLEHIEKFDPASSGGGFKAWLFRIATNKANDLWRSHGRQRAAHDGLKLVTDQSAPEAGARLEASDDEAKLRVAIARLPEAQRQVLMLRYYSGLKFAEIAEMLGCPLNTALGRMHKAMVKLKELMES